MREILFRGKCVDNGEWVYGYLMKRPNLNTDYIVTVGNAVWYAVIPETIGQYTGLTDKNGTKIFEGDILKGEKYPYFRDGSYNYYAIVIWFENSPAFGTLTWKAKGSKVSGISSGSTDYIEDFDSSKWEVIGNIIDNPELLDRYIE